MKKTYSTPAISIMAMDATTNLMAASPQIGIGTDTVSPTDLDVKEDGNWEIFGSSYEEE